MFLFGYCVTILYVVRYNKMQYAPAVAHFDYKVIKQ